MIGVFRRFTKKLRGAKKKTLQSVIAYFDENRGLYFPWVVYRGNPIDARNIRLGWVLATRIARVRLDGPARREAVSLAPPGKAIADPRGLALTSDEQRLVVSASGTHELLVYPSIDLKCFTGNC